MSDSGYWQETFDLQDPGLPPVLDELPFWSAPFGLRLMEAIPYRRGQRALDIGCGTGFPFLELAMRLGPSCFVAGLEPWAGGRQRVRQKLDRYRLDNALVVAGCAEELPFREETFDLLVSNNGLNNVQDLSRSLGECRRVCRAGGRLIFTANTDRTFHRFYALLAGVLTELGRPDLCGGMEEHIRRKRPSVPVWETTLGQNGFVVQAVQEDSFSYRFADGTALFRHFFMKLAFLPAWKEVVPEENRPAVFSRLEYLLNREAEPGGICLPVPFLLFDCRKK